MTEKKLLFPGSVLDIYVILQDDRSEVGEFIGHLTSPDLGQFSHLKGALTHHGIPRNTSKFRNEGNGIYALKTQHTRIYGFFEGPKSFVLALGFKKGGKGGRKVERRYWERACEIRKLLRSNEGQEKHKHGS
jgi:hypothetical protein